MIAIFLGLMKNQQQKNCVIANSTLTKLSGWVYLIKGETNEGIIMKKLIKQ